MIGSPLHEGIGGGRPQREVADVQETRAEDKSLDKLLNVRRQRLDRYERERSAARNAWRDAREALREAKEQWRRLRREASEFWMEARAGYFRMTCTSGEFRKSKAIYERMKKQAAEQRLACLEHVEQCRQSRTAYFEARHRALQANRDQEKLKLLRDEIRSSNRQPET